MQKYKIKKEDKQILNVWDFNFEEELNNIIDLIEDYTYISIVRLK